MTKPLQLAAVFAMAVTATACANPMMHAPETIATLSNGDNSWDIARTEHGSNALYIAKCADIAKSKTQDSDAPEYIGKVDGLGTYFTFYKGHRIYMTECTPGKQATALNNVRWENHGRGEDRSVTQTTIIPGMK